MVDGVGLALSSLKVAAETAKTLFEIRDISKVHGITIELQGQIAATQSLALAAQREQAALVGEVESLKKKIVEFENWSAEKQRYQLEELPPGILVYRLKTGMENGEPPHRICANCYNRGTKALLHVVSQGSGLPRWKCQTCGFDEKTGNFVPPQTNARDRWRD